MPTLSVPGSIRAETQRRTPPLRSSTCRRDRRSCLLPRTRRRDSRLVPGRISLASGTADPASLRYSAAPVLSLPSLAAVPPFLVYRRGGYGLCGLAEGLLEEGVLRSSDWTGDLKASVEAGFQRWLTTEMGVDGFDHLDLRFVYTDSMEEWYEYHENHWLPTFDGLEGEPIGAFALEAESYQEVFVGERVNKWEETFAGLGYALLGLVSYSLWCTIGAVTPQWAFSRVSTWCDLELDTRFDELEPDTTCEEDLPENYLTPQRLFKTVPQQACKALWNEAVVRKALRRCKGLSEERKDLLRRALKLGALVDAAKSDPDFGCHQNLIDVEQVLTVAVRWSRNDDIYRVSDDYHNMNDGVESRFVFLSGYQVPLAGSLVKAVRNIRRTLAILREADWLLSKLHTPALSEIFAAQETQQETTDTVPERIHLRARARA